MIDVKIQGILREDSKLTESHLELKILSPSEKSNGEKSDSYVTVLIDNSESSFEEISDKLLKDTVVSIEANTYKTIASQDEDVKFYIESEFCNIYL